ncbi:hypothetical protein, partial [Neisseria sp. HMSC064E01]|uniref:hypothetical protein n=1 Tax=Neisseria sp. HMSC064E01 TaxID=1715052 RepID=UPI001AEFB8C3
CHKTGLAVFIASGWKFSAFSNMLEVWGMTSLSDSWLHVCLYAELFFFFIVFSQGIVFCYGVICKNC